MPRISFEDAVQVYGTDNLRLQCYLHLAVPSGAIEEYTLGGSWRTFILNDDNSTPVILLLEKSVTGFDVFAQESLSVLLWASCCPDVKAAALIFDGGFCGGSELFSEDTVDQVYGIVAQGTGPIMTFDRNLMMSTAWKALLIGMNSPTA